LARADPVGQENRRTLPSSLGLQHLRDPRRHRRRRARHLVARWACSPCCSSSRYGRW